MPPKKADQRKSDISAVAADTSTMSFGSAAGAESQGTPKAGSSAPEKKEKEKDKDKDKDATTIEDLTLPKSIITRLAKGVLPPNTQIQANAILAMSKSATVFINYLASHANENTVNANKKTIAPADVFKALDDIEFSFLKEPLEAEFAKFNQIQTEKRTNYRQKVRAKQDPSGGNDDTEMADTTVADTTISSETAGANAAAPRAKKARVDPSAEEDDAATEEDPDAQIDDAEEEEDDDDDEEEAGEGEEEDDDDEEEGQSGSGDETQDALEEKPMRDEGDEALDGDESD